MTTRFEIGDEKQDILAEYVTEQLKRNIRESLVFAVASTFRTLRKELSISLARVVISDFYHSLNRKHILLNNEVEEEIEKAYEQLSEVMA